MERPTVLVVDRDARVRERWSREFEARDVVVFGAADAPAALELLRTRQPTVAAVDSSAPGVETTNLLETARRLRPAVAIVLLDDDPPSTEPRRLEEIGVFDVVARGADPREIRRTVSRSLRHGRALEECRQLRDRLRRRAGYDALVGNSALMERLREDLQRAAESDAAVMFLGEPGSGRELAARTLHATSHLAALPFVVVSCRRAGPELTERAAAVGEECAERVLFLDDVLALAPSVQQRLLVSYSRAESGLGPPPAARVLSACSGDPGAAAEEGRLLRGLHDRLAVVTIAVPPLRDRAEDLGLLASRFIEELRELNDLPPIRLAPTTIALLEHYHWPGNVRELRSAIEQAVIVAGSGEIEPAHLPGRIQQHASADDGSAGPSQVASFRDAKREVVEKFERRYLRALLDRHRGNVTSAAQNAGMLRSALQRLLRKHGIRSAEFRRRTPMTD